MDNPWASAKVTNQEWEQSIFGFLEAPKPAANNKRVLNPRFRSRLLGMFTNLSDKERTWFLERS